MPSPGVPTTADEAFDQARTHLDGARPGAAIPLLQRALELDPSCAKAAVELAATLADSGHGADGRAVLDTYLDRYPRASLVRLARGQLNLRAGHLEEAAADLRQCVDEQPDRVEPRAKLILVLCRQGLEAEAEAALAALRGSGAADARELEMLTRLVVRTFPHGGRAD